MRVAVMLALFSLIGVGCSTTGRNQSPIVGTWILNVARTSPAAAADPKLAKSVTGSMTFLSNGTYRSSTTFNGHTNDNSGTWRLEGNDLCIKEEGRQGEGHLTVHGNDLIDYAKYEPGAMIYERQR